MGEEQEEAREDLAKGAEDDESRGDVDEEREADDGGEDGEARADDERERPKRRRRKRRGRGRGASAPRSEESYDPGDDERAEKALAFVSTLVQKMGMDCRVQLLPPKDPDDGEISLEIHGEDAGRIIGKKGQVLSAIQFITNRVINRPGLERRHILVDAEGYRKRRESSLASMARRLGKQAVTDGKIITFEPMNPRDRRVVHLALAKFEGVVTKSEGEGDDRRVQIIPVRR